jgi:SAM-dependent methyltransferase
MDEVKDIKDQYARRETRPELAQLYNPLVSSNVLMNQERDRELIRLIRIAQLEPVSEKKVLEIGCGTGGNLLQLLKLGFRPEFLTGNELLEGRSSIARQRLPISTSVVTGDATALDLAPESFDIVMLFTVFSSILDKSFQKKLADKAWQLIRPGGGIIWYDFMYNNPKNPDVKGIKLKHIQALFPEAVMSHRRLTLAPPITRAVTKIHPLFYFILNSFPALRTHSLCWLKKEGG